jgi:hypothetical protein
VARTDVCGLVREVNEGLSARRGHEAAGRLRIDTESSRVLGSFRAWARYDDAFRMDIEHASLMGAHRESITMVIRGDSLETVDWRRGEYLGPEESLARVAEVLGIELGADDLLRLGLWLLPPCGPGMEAGRAGASVRVSGPLGGGTFTVRVDEGFPRSWRWEGPEGTLSMELEDLRREDGFLRPGRILLENVAEGVSVLLELREYRLRDDLGPDFFVF